MTDRLTPAAFEALVAAAGGNAAALMTLAFRSRRTQRGRASELAQAALALAPGDPALAAMARAIAATGVPKWHFRMMRDGERNSAYAAAIARAVQPGSRVLDIGAGSGLLSMMAARAGAAQVVGCEMDPVIAAVARDVVATNGLAGQISILAAHSGSLDAERDLGGRADVVVSEIIGKDLVCEGVLPALRDAAKRLLAPGGRMIPAAGHVRVALADWPDWVTMAGAPQEGFDLSPFDQLQPPSRGVAVGDPMLALRSAPDTLLAFDFAATTAQPMAGTIDLVATGGRVSGVVQWIGLQLDDQTWFENRPQAGTTSSWAAMFTRFDTPIDARAGARVQIGGRVVDDRLILWHEAA